MFCKSIRPLSQLVLTALPEGATRQEKEIIDDDQKYYGDPRDLHKKKK